MNSVIRINLSVNPRVNISFLCFLSVEGRRQEVRKVNILGCQFLKKGKERRKLEEKVPERGNWKLSKNYHENIRRTDFSAFS